MLQTDYLVIGAGVSSIAFVDELIHKNKDINIIVIDKHGKAGGHWNDAYPFSKLQEPANWYGVNSRDLGSGGPRLVSRTEILAYYEQVVEELISTGRVKFYWQCEYKGDGKFSSFGEEDL